LGEILNANPDGILVFRDELTGWLRSLDKDGRETDRAFYLEAWNGSGSYDYDRIGRGNVYIEAACVSILGGIQPGPLSQYVRSAEHGGQGADGLLQRFQLMVYPDDTSDWQDIDRWPNTTAKNEAYEVFKRLAYFDPLRFGATQPDEDMTIPYFRFSPEAQALFSQWRAILEREKLRQGEPEMIEAHLSKYRSLIPSMALLCHLADGGTGPIDEMAMIRASAWSDYLESHARRVFADALVPDVVPATALAHRILAGDLGNVFTLRDIYHRHWQSLDRPSTEKAIEYLEDLDWLLIETRKTGGRPSVICKVNPKLKQV
jgi:putative DNA primase/helicase